MKATAETNDTSIGYVFLVDAPFGYRFSLEDRALFMLPSVQGQVSQDPFPAGI